MKNFKNIIISFVLIVMCFMFTGCFGTNSDDNTQTPIPDEWESATSAEQTEFIKYFTETCDNTSLLDKYSLTYEKTIDDVKLNINATIYKYNENYEGFLNFVSGNKTYEVYMLNNRLYVKKTIDTTETKFSTPLNYKEINTESYLNADAREVVGYFALAKSLTENIQTKVREDALKAATCNILNKTTETTNNFKINLNYDQIALKGLIRNNIQTVLKYNANKIHYFSYYCNSVLASDESVSNQELSYTLSSNTVSVQFPTLKDYKQVI